MEAIVCPYFLNMIQGEEGDDREGLRMGKNWISKGRADPLTQGRLALTVGTVAVIRKGRQPASRTWRFSVKFVFFRSFEDVGIFAGSFGQPVGLQSK